MCKTSSFRRSTSAISIAQEEARIERNRRSGGTLEIEVTGKRLSAPFTVNCSKYYACELADSIKEACTFSALAVGRREDACTLPPGMSYDATRATLCISELSVRSSLRSVLVRSSLSLCRLVSYLVSPHFPPQLKPELENIETFGFCNKKVLERFVLLTENPTILRKAQAAKMAIKAMDHKEKHFKNDFLSAFDAQREAASESIQRDLEVEEQKLRDESDTRLQEEISKLKAAYAAELEIKIRKKRALYERRKKVMAEYTEKERVAAEKMLADASVATPGRKEAEQQVAIKAEIFEGTPYDRMRLLILAEYLGSNVIRDEMVDDFCQREAYEKIAQMPIVSCRLLPRTTTRTIIQRLHVRDLLALADFGEHFDHHAVVRQELNDRRWFYRSEYEKMSNEDLREVLSGKRTLLTPRSLSGSPREGPGLEGVRVQMEAAQDGTAGQQMLENTETLEGEDELPVPL